MHSTHEVEYEGEIQEREAAKLDILNPIITYSNASCVGLKKK